MISLGFYESVTDGRTDGRTDRRTDMPDYRDARIHLKREKKRNREKNQIVAKALHGQVVHDVKIWSWITPSLMKS